MNIFNASATRPPPYNSPLARAFGGEGGADHSTSAMARVGALKLVCFLDWTTGSLRHVPCKPVTLGASPRDMLSNDGKVAGASVGLCKYAKQVPGACELEIQQTNVYFPDIGWMPDDYPFNLLIAPATPATCPAWIRSGYGSRTMTNSGEVLHRPGWE